MVTDMMPHVSETDAEGLRTFIRDYIVRSGADGVIIGLSGGLDSAVVTKLAVDALGADRVHTMYLPSDMSPKADLRCTEELSRTWGVGLEVINIQSALDAFRDLLGTDMTPMEMGNASARCRMSLLYARARSMNRIVVGTSNRSEIMMGYFTKHGDGACDILPLAGLYKTEVRELAELIGVPGDVISKPPSAGFWEGQTDEDEMGFPYAVLDRILVGMERGETAGETSRETGVLEDRIEEIRGHVASVEHKRRPAARPGVPF